MLYPAGLFRQAIFLLCTPDCQVKACDRGDTEQGDRARGISAERFEIPLAGGAAAAMIASAFCWRSACAAWGEPSPPRLSPGETGKGDQIPCCRRRIRFGSIRVGHEFSADRAIRNRLEQQLPLSWCASFEARTSARARDGECGRASR